MVLKIEGMFSFEFKKLWPVFSKIDEAIIFHSINLNPAVFFPGI